jgi:translation initiation factor IF-1
MIRSGDMNRKLFFQILSSVLIVTITFFGFGCAPAKQSIPLETQLKLHSKKVALVPSQMPIESKVNLYAENRFEGAFKGAGSGAGAVAGGIGTGGGGCSGGAICGVVVLFYLAAVVVGATVGSIYGAATAPSGSRVKKMETGLGGRSNGFLSQKTLAQLLADKLQKNTEVDIEVVPLEGRSEDFEADSYELLRQEGFEELISLNLAKVEFKGGKGSDPPLSLQMTAVVEIVDLNQPEDKIKREYNYYSQPVNYDVWMSKTPEVIKEDFRFAIDTLVEKIYSNVFVDADLQVSAGSFNSPEVGNDGCCWICPEDPPVVYLPSEKRLDSPIVESRQPTLRWIDFPDSTQAEQFNRTNGRSVEIVTYDLRVWEGLSTLVYEVNDIADNYHELEVELDSATNYFWSVRGCFEAEGKEVCTSWGRSYLPERGEGCQSKYVSADNYYRFKTPEEGIPQIGVLPEKSATDIERKLEENRIELKNGDVVLVEFNNGNKRIITVTNFNGKILSGHYEYNSFGQTTMNNFELTKIKKITMQKSPFTTYFPEREGKSLSAVTVKNQYPYNPGDVVLVEFKHSQAHGDKYEVTITAFNNKFLSGHFAYNSFGGTTSGIFDRRDIERITIIKKAE